MNMKRGFEAFSKRPLWSVLSRGARVSLAPEGVNENPLKGGLNALNLRKEPMRFHYLAYNVYIHNSISFS